MIRHSCDNPVIDCQACGQDFLQDLLLFIPIMKKFCNGLECLSLLIEDKTWAEDEGEDEEQDKDDGNNQSQNGQKNRLKSKLKQHLRPVLENQVCDIGSLRELVVRVKDDEAVTGVAVGFANNAIMWIRSRWEQRRRLQRGAVQERYCDFCGEDHVWAVCHNLCRSCGKYGHLRCSGGT